LHREVVRCGSAHISKSWPSALRSETPSVSTAYKSGSPWNETYWKRSEFDRLLIAARAELDTAKRKQMYRELQLMVHEDGGAIIPISCRAPPST
jgi:peptide/nickel transport system substrate-binding protein